MQARTNLRGFVGMNEDTSWRQDLAGELARNNETWADVEAHTMSEEQLDAKFDHRYGV